MLSTKDKQKAQKTAWRNFMVEEEIYKLIRRKIHINKKKYNRKSDNWKNEI